MWFWLFFNQLCNPVTSVWKKWFRDAIECPACQTMVVPFEFSLRQLEYMCHCGWQHKERIQGEL